MQSASICEKHSCLEKTQYCIDCKTIMCALCQAEHMPANPSHKFTSMADILCALFTFYNELKSSTPGDDGEKTIDEIKEKIAQIKCFGECVKSHVVSMSDTITCKQVTPLMNGLKTAESIAAKRKEILNPEMQKKLTDKFIKKDYLSILDLYHQLPELKANITNIKQECVELKQKLPASGIQDFGKVKEFIEKFVEMVFNEANADKTALQSPGTMLSPCEICKKYAYVCSRCKQACTLCGKDIFCEKCCFECDQCKKLHCIKCLKTSFYCDTCKKKLCGQNGIGCCNKLALLNTGTLYKFESSNQFYGNNTSHWYTQNMHDTRMYNPYAFDGGKLGWVKFDMSKNMQKINRLVYSANSFNRIAVEHSKDGSNFTELLQFEDNKPVVVIDLNVTEKYPFWRVRMVSSGNRGPYHHAMWYY